MMDIFVVGFPKAGTTWLCRLLGDILNSPVGAIYKPASDKAIATEGQDRSGKYYIGQGHPVPTNEWDVLIPDHLHLNLDYLKDEKIILMYRDPRDVCVSVMYHWEIENIHKAIECVGEGKWPVVHGGGFVKFYEQWHKSSIGYLFDKGGSYIRYEWLNSDTPLYEIIKLYEYITDTRVFEDILYGRFDTSNWKQVIKHQSFTNRKEWTKQYGDILNYGKKWQLKFLRKGIVGDWKNHFDDKAIEMSEHYFGDYIR